MTEEILRKLGLSPYESKCYMALVSHGNLGGKEIAKLSSVPPTSVYKNLESLKENHKNLSDILKGTDPRFLINIDECGWGKLVSKGRKHVVSLSPSKTTYGQKTEEGHITLIPISYANGDFACSMIVIQTKTIE